MPVSTSSTGHQRSGLCCQRSPSWNPDTFARLLSQETIFRFQPFVPGFQINQGRFESVGTSRPEDRDNPEQQPHTAQGKARIEKQRPVGKLHSMLSRRNLDGPEGVVRLQNLCLSAVEISPPSRIVTIEQYQV